jgi:hypothetical protein
MSTTLLVSADLIFTTKIKSTADSLGRKVMVRASGDLLHQDTCHEPEGTESIQRNTGEQSEQDRTIACVMVDLLAPRTGVEELRRIRTLFESPVRLIAFGSHVDVERLREARSAGFDEVLPRSEFTRRLVSLLQGA